MSKQPLIANRYQERGLTIPKTAVFIAGEIAGTGILALSKAVDNTGWAGLILMILCGILSAYTGILLGDAWVMASRLFKDCEGHVQDPYQLLGEKSYGKPGRYVVSFCVHFTLFGGAVVFLLLSADNMESLITALGYDISFCYWILIIAGCLYPLTLFGTPKDFWLIGYGATLATASAAVIILVSMGLDASSQPPVQHQAADFEKISLAFGTIVFALGGHPAFPTFQMDMKRQSDFKWAVSIGFFIVLLMYIPVSSAGYFIYGKALDDNILKNLPSDGLSYAVQILVTMHLVLAMVIVLSPVIQEFEQKVNVPKEFTWKRCLSRLVIVAFVLFAAETIPKFSAVLSLIGGSTLTVLDFIFPILFYMKMCKLTTEAESKRLDEKPLRELQAVWDEQKEILPLWKKVMNIEIIIIGLLAGVASSVSAVISIVSPDSFSMPCYVNITAADT